MYDLLEWVHRVTFKLGFIIIILRFDTTNRQLTRNTYMLLGYEKGGKYKIYKNGLLVTITSIRKCDCLFKLQSKSVM